MKHGSLKSPGKLFHRTEHRTLSFGLLFLTWYLVGDFLLILGCCHSVCRRFYTDRTGFCRDAGVFLPHDWLDFYRCGRPFRTQHRDFIVDMETSWYFDIWCTFSHTTCSR